MYIILISKHMHCFVLPVMNMHHRGISILQICTWPTTSTPLHILNITLSVGVCSHTGNYLCDHHTFLNVSKTFQTVTCSFFFLSTTSQSTQNFYMYYTCCSKLFLVTACGFCVMQATLGMTPKTRIRKVIISVALAKFRFFFLNYKVDHFKLFTWISDKLREYDSWNWCNMTGWIVFLEKMYHFVGVKLGTALFTCNCAVAL